MTREEAKKMAQSRDCHCVKGKDRDTNYAECIDKIFDLKTGTKRKPRTEEHRRNLSNAAKGKQPMLGKKHSDETKQKMRDTRKRLAAEKRVD